MSVPLSVMIVEDEWDIAPFLVCILQDLVLIRSLFTQPLLVQITLKIFKEILLDTFGFVYG